MLGCKNSAVVFSPESSICSDCPHFGGCHKAALDRTREKRPKARAAFLSVQYATNGVDQDELTDIRLASVSKRVKDQALLLNRKGFRFSDARTLLRSGINPFESVRTQRAYVTVFDLLMKVDSVRKCDLVEHIMGAHRCSQSTAAGLVSDALGLGELMGVVRTTRFMAELHIEADT